MKQELKNIIFSKKIYNIFQKYHWNICLSSKNDFKFSFKGDIADYYLLIKHQKNNLYFEYTLDIPINKNKTYDLLMLINLINQKSELGYFIYDFKINRIKFKLEQSFFKLNDKIFEKLVKKNLTHTNYLFNNFIFAIHNLFYAEKIDESFIELLFLKVKGNA